MKEFLKTTKGKIIVGVIGALLLVAIVLLFTTGIFDKDKKKDATSNGPTLQIGDEEDMDTIDSSDFEMEEESTPSDASDDDKQDGDKKDDGQQGNDNSGDKKNDDKDNGNGSGNGNDNLSDGVDNGGTDWSPLY